MSKSKKYLKISLVFLLGVIFGGFAGGYLGFQLSKPINSMGYLMASASLGNYSYLQYQNASYEDAKKALLEYIQFCDELKRQLNAEFLFGKEICVIDSGTAYARLAVLEGKRGKTEKYKSYMKEAQAKYQSGGWKDFSEKKILKFLTKVDSKNFINKE
ncbi:MAG: hypothetical protein OEV42_09425 [Deltaproteobacteria bacterium]|nr:hypothetical protein [Deltaproteobacteria bacterium]